LIAAIHSAYDGLMKRIARDPKRSRPASLARALDDRHLRDVRGGSSVIKPEQMAQVAWQDDWLAPI
jgi:hypothetical protein